MIDTMIRRGSMEELDNPAYYRKSDNSVYYKYQTYSNSNSALWKNYSGCTFMESVEYATTAFKNPSPIFAQNSSFLNMPNLRSIKCPLCITQGHYPFSDCSNVTYIQLGSVGHDFQGMGYFGNAGLGGNTVGTAAGLTIDCYIKDSSFSTSYCPAGFTTSGYPNIWYTTTMRVYSATTGNLLGINKGGTWTYIREEN